ncbi:MAG: F0F1 ATP synthase subunit epsilon [Candidatus Pacebacteria bacterium]|nr:F0F1 ATP synthase subunit epsilon [Candidatus Paceibacterota bacterium]
MEKIKFKIVTPERIVFEDEVDQATLPTSEGEITVLPKHIPLVSVLKPGELLLKKNKKEIPMAVSGGLIEVGKNEIVVLADTAEHAYEIDEQRAEEAKRRAEEMMKTASREMVDNAALVSNLEKELARLKVVRRHKSRSININ